MPDCDAAVWAIRTSALDEEMRSFFGGSSSNLTEEQMSRILVTNSISCQILYEDNARIALAYGTPEHLNPRLINQKGLFVFPLDVKRTFMENLAKGLAVDSASVDVCGDLESFQKAATTAKVLKIVVPKCAHDKILSYLGKVNITDAELFPGLDGFARSLNRYILEPE